LGNNNSEIPIAWLDDEQAQLVSESPIDLTDVALHLDLQAVNNLKQWTRIGDGASDYREGEDEISVDRGKVEGISSINGYVNASKPSSATDEPDINIDSQAMVTEKHDVEDEIEVTAGVGNFSKSRGKNRGKASMEKVVVEVGVKAQHFKCKNRDNDFRNCPPTYPKKPFLVFHAYSKFLKHRLSKHLLHLNQK
jgi:hypothetical protein